MADASLLVAGGALVVSGVSGYATFRLGQRQTTLTERQTELAERQVEADTERARRALLPWLEIYPGAIANEGGGAAWTIRVRNRGSVEARDVQVLAMPDEDVGDVIVSEEEFDIPSGEERPFQLVFPVAVVAEVGSMDQLREHFALHAIDRDSNEFVREP